jgi:hypothetical protein
MWGQLDPLEELTLPPHNLQSRQRAYPGGLPREFEIPMPREPNARKVWTAQWSAKQKARSFCLAPCVLFGEAAR